MDEAIGAVLAELKALGVERRTGESGVSAAELSAARELNARWDAYFASRSRA